MISAIRFSLGFTLRLLGVLDEVPDIKLEMQFIDVEKCRELENVGTDWAWVDTLKGKSH